MADQTPPSEGTPQGPPPDAGQARRVAPPPPPTPQQGRVRIPTGPLAGQGPRTVSQDPPQGPPDSEAEPAQTPKPESGQPPAEQPQPGQATPGDKPAQPGQPEPAGLPQNWLEDESFRRYSAAQQEKLRQAREAAEQAQRDALQLRQQLEQIQTADLDDFGRLQYEAQKIQAENAELRAAMAQRDEIDRMYAQKVEDTTAMAQTYGVPQSELMKFETPGEAEAWARQQWMEQTRQELQRGVPPQVDIGGSDQTVAAPNDLAAEIERAKAAGDYAKATRLQVYGK
jgi:hypothetical protein